MVRSVDTDGVLTASFRGHLTNVSLASALGAVGQQVDSTNGPHALLLDCTQMDDYDLNARQAFIEWNAKYRKHLRGVAIVTEKKMWHIAIRTMAVLSKQTMKPFADHNEAVEWLNSKLT